MRHSNTPDNNRKSAEDVCYGDSLTEAEENRKDKSTYRSGNERNEVNRFFLWRVDLRVHQPTTKGNKEKAKNECSLDQAFLVHAINPSV